MKRASPVTNVDVRALPSIKKIKIFEKGLIYFNKCIIIFRHCGVWRSLVSRLVRDQEAGGSSPLTPTRKRRL